MTSFVLNNWGPELLLSPFLCDSAHTGKTENNFCFSNPELQIKRISGNNSENDILFFFLNENICCSFSLEPILMWGHRLFFCSLYKCTGSE